MDDVESESMNELREIIGKMMSEKDGVELLVFAAAAKSLANSLEACLQKEMDWMEASRKRIERERVRIERLEKTMAQAEEDWKIECSVREEYVEGVYGCVEVKG